MTLALISARCSSLQVPTRTPDFAENQFFRASKQGITIEVHPIEGLNEYYDLFDADLPAAGIVSLWVRVHNTRTDLVDLSKIRWTMNSKAGIGIALDPRAVLNRFYNGRHIRMYTLAADRSSQRSLEQMMFQGVVLRPGQLQEGFLFFKIGLLHAKDWTQDASIKPSGIRFVNRATLEVEIPIRYANP